MVSAPIQASAMTGGAAASGTAQMIESGMRLLTEIPRTSTSACAGGTNSGMLCNRYSYSPQPSDRKISPAVA